MDHLPELTFYVDRARCSNRTRTLRLGDRLELFRQNLKRIRGSLANQTQVTSVYFGLPVSEPELLELIFDCNIRLLLDFYNFLD